MSILSIFYIILQPIVIPRLRRAINENTFGLRPDLLALVALVMAPILLLFSFHAVLDGKPCDFQPDHCSTRRNDDGGALVHRVGFE